MWWTVTLSSHTPWWQQHHPTRTTQKKAPNFQRPRHSFLGNKMTHIIFILIKPFSHPSRPVWQHLHLSFFSAHSIRSYLFICQLSCSCGRITGITEERLERCWSTTLASTWPTRAQSGGWKSCTTMQTPTSWWCWWETRETWTRSGPSPWRRPGTLQVSCFGLCFWWLSIELHQELYQKKMCFFSAVSNSASKSFLNVRVCCFT